MGAPATAMQQPLGTYQFAPGPAQYYTTANMPTVGSMNSIPTAPQLQAGLAFPAQQGYYAPDPRYAQMQGTAQPATNPQLFAQNPGFAGPPGGAAPPVERR